MRIGSGDHWLTKSACDSLRPAIRIERTNVKMTELNRVKTIDRGDIQHNDVSPKQTHLNRGNQQNAHCRRIGEHFLSVKHSVVQGDREHAKSERARALQ